MNKKIYVERVPDCKKVLIGTIDESKELVLNSPIKEEVDIKNLSFYFHHEYFIEDEETGYNGYSRVHPNVEDLDEVLVVCEGETFVLGVNKYDEEENKINLVFYDQYLED